MMDVALLDLQVPGHRVDDLCVSVGNRVNLVVGHLLGSRYLLAFLSLCLSVCLSLSMHPPVCLLPPLSLSLSAYLSVCLYV